MSDQRAQPRLEVNNAYQGIADYASEYVVNVSRTGVFIKSATPHPVGSRVALRFAVYLDDFHIIEGEGTVARIVTEGPESGMGVAFTSLSPDNAKILEEVQRRSNRR